MRRALPIGILVVAICLAVFAWSASGSLRVVPEQSYYSDFRIERNAVLVVCRVEVENRAPAPRTFGLKALLPQDVEGGLLKEAKLTGYDQSLSSDRFTVRGDSSESFDVVFVGEFAGTNRKQDRLLPEIVFTP